MKNEKKRKKIVNYKRFAIVTISFLVLICALIFGGVYFYLSKLNNNSVDLSKKDITSKLSKEELEKISNEGGSCNILIMGVDVGTPGATNDDDPKRTDTMIVAHYNAKDKKLSLVSIPRDTLIQIDGKNQKINAAHFFGGVASAVSAVEELLGIKIDYYGKIDYEGFRKVIDAIGGVDMEITNEMNYDDPTQDLSIHFKKGTTVHLDGKKAEEFFRWRKNNDGTGLARADLDRIKNQQLFISKVMAKVKSPTILIKIPSILSAIQSYVETNMDANGILKYGYLFATMGKDKISMDTINTDEKYINNISYVVYDEAKNKDILSKLNDSQVQNIDKSKYKIKILNGTKKSGLASDFSKYLSENGYNKAVTDNGDPTSKTKIIVYNKSEDIKADLIKDFKTDNIEFLSSEEENFDIIVMLGEDHDYIY